jgi:hypothetical protein
MVFKYRAQGSGAVIETQNPIVGWGQNTTEGAEKPEYAKSYPAGQWTSKHPEPGGERPRYYDDRTRPSYSESGSNYPFRAGKSAAPGVNAPRGAKAGFDRGVPKGIPERNRFAQGFSYLGSGSGGGKGRRGKSG